MKYNNLLLDIDGILIGTEKSPVGHDSRLKKFLDFYMQEEGRVGLVTGRSENYTSAIYEFLGLNGVRIVEIGAGLIMPDNKRIELTPLQNVDKIKEFFSKLGLFNIFKEEPKSFMFTLMPIDFPYHNINKLREAYDAIKESFEEKFPYAKITVDDHTIDIFNPKSDKGEAIKFYAQKDNANLENMVVVGDSRGDYPVFKEVGKSNGQVCYVGLDDNYAKELKNEFSNYVRTKNKRSSGVVEVLKYLLKIK